MRFNSCYHLTF